MIIAEATGPVVNGLVVCSDGKEGGDVGNKLPREGPGRWQRLGCGCCRYCKVDLPDGFLDKLGVVAGKFEGTEALASGKVFQHVQEEFVQQSVIGLGRGEEGQCGIDFWLDAVSMTFLLEVEQAACMKSQISMFAEPGAWGGG